MEEKSISRSNTHLRDERLRKRWTQKDLADQLGTTKLTVGRWERGVAVPGPYFRLRLAALFGKSVEELGLIPEGSQPAVSAENEIALPDEDFPSSLSQDSSHPFESHSQLSDDEPGMPTTAVSPSQQMHRSAHATAHINQNRSYMLRRLGGAYRDLLEHSLQGAVWIELGLSKLPHAVQNAANLLLRIADQAEQPLPPGTSLLQVYEEAENELLILGAPGSGKSTLLLELALQLVKQAQLEETLPLPVILPLSSWAQKRPAIEDWLSEQLVEVYDVPKKLARNWVEDEQILPLLDGLDEMEEAARPACIVAINAYHHTHLGPLVVCSRHAEYELVAQKERLHLQRAVLIQPLTDCQIETVLAQGGAALETLRHAYRTNPALQELARTPLMLNLLMLTYQGSEPEAFSEQETALNKQVWDDYVHKMVERKGNSKLYPREQTLARLSWLAQQMRDHNQTVFYLEHLQPDWLTKNRLHRFVQRYMVMLSGMLIAGLIILLFTTILFRTDVFTIFVGLSMLSLAGLFIARSNAPATGKESGNERRRNIWAYVRTFWRWVVSDMFVGLGTAVGIALQNGGTFSLNGLYDGLIYGFVGVLLSVFLIDNKRMNELLQRRFKRLSRSFPGFWRKLGVPFFTHEHGYNGLVVGLTCWLGYALHEALKYTLPFGLLFGLNEGLRYGLLFGLAGTLSSILIERKTGEIKPAEIIIWSWRGLVRRLFDPGHLKSAVFIAVSVGLVSGFSYGALRGSSVLKDGGYGFGVTLPSLFSYWLLLSFAREISSDRLREEHRVRPNQGMWYSARNSVLIGGLSALVGWLSAALVVGFLDELSTKFYIHKYSLLGILLFGLACGLLGGLLNGGLACLQYLVLRWLLWRSRSLPWRASQFLDDATARFLLRRVGGGYSFSHRLLLDYFVATRESDV